LFEVAAIELICVVVFHHARDLGDEAFVIAGTPQEMESLQAVIPEIEWRRRERENVRTALQLAKGRIYGPDGAADRLGVKPTTLISRLNALGLREPPKRPRRGKNRP
jgi:transcriptional regulator with GAF, ATPase, and Fis domain